MQKMPASRARRQISATGKISADGEVMWERKTTFVRGVTPDQIASTISAESESGTGISWRL
jgi:hypothetical protein